MFSQTSFASRLDHPLRKQNNDFFVLFYRPFGRSRRYWLGRQLSFHRAVKVTGERGRETAITDRRLFTTSLRGGGTRERPTRDLLSLRREGNAGKISPCPTRFSSRLFQVENPSMRQDGPSLKKNTFCPQKRALERRKR